MAGEINLAVPYKSQHGIDSKASNNDCGAASLAMVLEFYGRKSSTGEILQLLGNPTGEISFQQLASVADKLDFNCSIASNATFEHILGYLQKGMPVIVVGGYGQLHSVQDTNFKGSHIMVVVGVRTDNSMYLNDPDFWGALIDEGNHHVYTFEEFISFWQYPGGNNTPNTLLVVNPKTIASQEQLPSQIVITGDKGVNARTSPVINNDNISRVFSKGNTLNVVAKVTGDSVSGNNIWYQINFNGSLLFVSASASIQLVMATNTPQGKLQELMEPPANYPPPPVPASPDPKVQDLLSALATIYKTTRDILKSYNALPDEQVGFWDKLKKDLGL